MVDKDIYVAMSALQTAGVIRFGMDMGLSRPRKLQGIQQCKDHFSSNWNFNLENDFFIHAIFVNNLRYITAIQSLMDEFLELCR
jgi:hypothetical protein